MPFAALSALLIAWSPLAPSSAAHAAEPPQRYLEAQREVRGLMGQPDRLIGVWERFADEHADDPLGYVGRIKQALWTLHAAHEADGRSGLENAVGPVLELLDWPEPVENEASVHAAPLYEHAHRAAMKLRARVEMIELAAALQAYYRRHIEYPESLEALIEQELIGSAQIVDPFGEPYRYKARARAIMPDQPRQTYTLACVSIPNDDDEPAGHRGLPRVLDRIEASADRIEVSTLVPEEGQAYVRSRRGDGSWTSARRWDVGRDRAGVRLWAVYDEFIIVGDGELPRVVRADD